MRKLLELVISRKKWGRGANGGSLRRRNGLMCCLGFAAKADGYTAITNIGMPDSIKRIANGIAPPNGGFLERLLNNRLHSNNVCCSLATTNDNGESTDKQKETRIKKLFAKQSIKVSFVA